MPTNDVPRELQLEELRAAIVTDSPSLVFTIAYQLGYLNDRVTHADSRDAVLRGMFAMFILLAEGEDFLPDDAAPVTAFFYATLEYINHVKANH